MAFNHCSTQSGATAFIASYKVSDQRLRYIMANPNVKIGSFQPIESMTKEELLVELSVEYQRNRNPG